MPPITTIEDSADKCLINLGEAEIEFGRFLGAVRTMPDLSDDLRYKLVGNALLIHSRLMSAAPSEIRKAGRMLRDSIKGAEAHALKTHFLFAVLGLVD